MASEIYVGRVRSVVLSVLLSIVTVTVYWFVWFYKLNRDLSRHLGRGSAAGRLLLFILVPVIGWFLATLMTGRSVRRAQLNAGVQDLTGSSYAAVWSIVPIIGWLIATGSLQHGANHAWLKMARAFDNANDVAIECPDCDARFSAFFNPLVSHPVACPQCGRAGEI